MRKPTATDYASDFNLFCEFVDTDGVMCTSRDEFEAIPFDERVRCAKEVIDCNA